MTAADVRLSLSKKNYLRPAPVRSRSSLLLHGPVATLNLSERRYIIHKMETIGGGLVLQDGESPIKEPRA